jgi:hypothetical protein
LLRVDTNVDLAGCFVLIQMSALLVASC